MKHWLQNPMGWVILTLCIALTPQVLTMPPHLAAITLLPIAWRIGAELRAWRPVPLLLRIAVTAVSTVILVTTYGGLGRRAAVSLLVIMLSVKLLETFRVRDARVVTSLSLFLCATQYLFEQHIPMLMYGAATMLAALVALILLQRAEAWGTLRPVPAAGTSMLSELRFGARLMVLAIPFGLALFLFFPRWGSPLWGIPEQALDAKSGLSDSMSPGSIQALFMDDTPAFRAQFESFTPSRQALYWRGPVFWEFDGLTWTGSYFGRNAPAESKPSARNAPWHYTVQLEPNERHWLFALDYPAVVPRRAKLTLDYQLVSSRPITQLKRYEMLSNPDFVDSPILRSALRAVALELPEGLNPRTRELVDGWREETSDDRAMVERTLKHFNAADFTYTLNPPLLSRHTVDDFLFNSRSGFCEHFASAFTVMMRMAGIPARVVTGYQGGWYNAFGNYVLVRNSDAHAWSEVWLEGSGWTRVDPTAAVAPDRVQESALQALGGRRHMFDFAWVRTVQNGFDLLNRTWNEWVIAFDATRQSGLLRPLGLERFGNAGLILLLAVTLGGLSVLLLPWLNRLREARRKDKAVRLWHRFRKRLARGGVQTSASMGPRELARAASGQLRERAAEIETVADLYQRLRYARSKPQLRELEHAVRAFRLPRFRRAAPT